MNEGLTAHRIAAGRDAGAGLTASHGPFADRSTGLVQEDRVLDLL
ncbi:hypothetical protein [Microbacterium sp. LWS13-1.2]